MKHDTIPMLDLAAEHRPIRDELFHLFDGIVENSAFIQGGEVTQFSKDLETFLEVNHVETCGNGTDALTAALLSLPLKKGDEVITSAFSFVAAAEAIKLLGLKPVFADIDPKTYNLCPQSVDIHSTKKTKAILPVHLFGQGADMQTLMCQAKQHNWYVIEDNAQSLGSKIKADDTWHFAGTIGDIGCTSFFPSKILGAMGDGGAMMTQDPTLAKELRNIVQHGSKKKYEHYRLGMNSRLDTLQAAVLRIKLRRLEETIACRRAVANRYDEILKDIPEITLPIKASFSTHVYHQYTIRINSGERDLLQKHLQSQGISTMVYYPVPLPLQKALHSRKKSDFRHAQKAAKEVLSLPIHPLLSQNQQDRIACEIQKYFQK